MYAVKLLSVILSKNITSIFDPTSVLRFSDQEVERIAAEPLGKVEKNRAATGSCGYSSRKSRMISANEPSNLTYTYRIWLTFYKWWTGTVLTVMANFNIGLVITEAFFFCFSLLLHCFITSYYFHTIWGQAPRYAILSHTWGEEEVSFQDFTHPNKEVRLRKAWISQDWEDVWIG